MSSWNPLKPFPEVTYARYIVPNFASNCISIKVDTNHYLVISPGPDLLQSWVDYHLIDQAIEDVRIDIVMPNHYHYLGVDAWASQLPNSRLFASELACKRLNTKLKHPVIAVQHHLPELPGPWYWLYPEGHPSGDLWLCAKNDDECLWIICDSFVNYPRLSRQPIARLTQRLAGTAPGLRISSVMKYLIIRNRPAFKSWCLHQLDQDKPTALLPSHGDPKFDANLAIELRELLLDRL